MKSILMLTLTLVLAQVGFANGENHNSAQNQEQQQQQTQQTSSTSSAMNGNQANSQVSNFSVPHQAPAVFAPNVYPTAPCVVPYSGGFSFLTGGGALGISHQDSECNKRAAAEELSRLGYQRAALHVLCTTKAVRQAQLQVCSQFPKRRKVKRH